MDPKKFFANHWTWYGGCILQFSAQSDMWGVDTYLHLCCFWREPSSHRPPPNLEPKFCFKMGENGIWPPPSPSPTCKYSVLHIYCGIFYLMWVKNFNAQRIRSIFSDFRLFLRFGPFFKNENFYCKQSQKHTISHKRSKVAKSMANDVWNFFWILSRGF